MGKPTAVMPQGGSFLLYEGKGGDDFWVKAETLLYIALIGYIHYELPPEEQNFATLIDMLNKMDAREDDEDYQNEVDLKFADLGKRKPGHFAVRQYAKYKMAAGVIYYMRHLEERKLRQRIAFFDGRRALNDRFVVCCPV